MLLIALNLTRNKQEDFLLPIQRAAKWYGISATTLQRGLDELRDADLLTIDPRWEEQPLEAAGAGYINHYGLKGPFSRAARFPEASA